MLSEYEVNDLWPAVDVAIDSLVEDGSPRISGESAEHVEALAAAQTPLPPIVVHRQTMRVVDGYHRLRVARRRGCLTIAVTYFDGSEADAFVLAVKLNTTHGLPLSLADRKRAAERIITLRPQWSDRMIGSIAGIASTTVAAIRERKGGEAGGADVRIGHDGRARPLDGSLGRRIAGQLMTENPELSLRQVARAAGISPETARDVRNRLRRGDDLTPRRSARDTALLRSARSAEIGELHVARAVEWQDGGGTVAGRSDIVQRLKADPALRLKEAGRDLLRLLALHTLSEDQWQVIIESIPSNRSGEIAELARRLAEVWADFAIRVDREVDTENLKIS